MEKRSSLRAPASGPVQLRVGERTVEGRIRDVGLEGIYVEVPPKGFRENDWLELDMSVPGAAGGPYRLRAVVTHRDEHGIGLMFADKDARLFRSIAELLRSHRDGSESAPEADSLDGARLRFNPRSD